MNNKKPLMAGERIESRCRRCNDIMGHIIVAMVGGEIYKVECQACRSIHRYHSPHKALLKDGSSRSRKAGDFADTGQKQAVLGSIQAKPRASRLPSSPSLSAGKAGSARAAIALENAWREAVNQHIGAAKPYAMCNAYEPDDLISHPSFGQGIVRFVERPNKMEVLFQDGVRLLRCSLEG